MHGSTYFYKWSCVRVCSSLSNVYSNHFVSLDIHLMKLFEAWWHFHWSSIWLLNSPAKFQKRLIFGPVHGSSYLYEWSCVRICSSFSNMYSNHFVSLDIHLKMPFEAWWHSHWSTIWILNSATKFQKRLIFGPVHGSSYLYEWSCVMVCSSLSNMYSNHFVSLDMHLKKLFEAW